MLAFVAELPAKMVFTGNLVLSADVFPRQSGFGGFSDCYLNWFSPPSRF
jgi:hypothetical protein